VVKDEDKLRKQYFEERKNDEWFQKFVVQEIFEESIKKLSDMRFMEQGRIMESSPEEVKNLLVAMTAARKEYEKNLSYILNH